MSERRKMDYIFRFLVVPIFLVNLPIIFLMGMVADKINGLDGVVKKNIEEVPPVCKEAYQYIRYGILK